MSPNDSSFQKYKAYADIRGGSPGRGRQITVGLSTTAIFGDLCGYFFGNVRDKSSNITWRCYPLSACNWLQNEWPRMTLSANFTSKSVFDQQGCRALAFTLARLSCIKSYDTCDIMALQQLFHKPVKLSVTYNGHSLSEWWHKLTSNRKLRDATLGYFTLLSHNWQCQKMS